VVVVVSLSTHHVGEAAAICPFLRLASFHILFDEGQNIVLRVIINSVFRTEAEFGNQRSQSRCSDSRPLI
jgi:hypothetical protein